MYSFPLMKQVKKKICEFRSCGNQIIMSSKRQHSNIAFWVVLSKKWPKLGKKNCLRNIDNMHIEKHTLSIIQYPVIAGKKTSSSASFYFYTSPILFFLGLACRILQVGPRGSKFLGPVLIEVPHVASLRDGDREVVVLRCDSASKGNWTEHVQEQLDDKTLKV